MSGTLLMFWDYDTQWGADRSRAGGGPKNWGHLEFEHTETLLAMHSDANVPACFAVVGSAALGGKRPYHDPDQIRRIHAAGHEIASHSHRHEWLPGLDDAALAETLRSSKDALEQCIGAPVRAFVPPYNQPFDYLAVGSISLAERREVPHRGRIDMPALCRALSDAGYTFCRVAYRTGFERLMSLVTRREWPAASSLTTIGGITCARLNTQGGFDTPVTERVQRAADEGGLVVVYGHPHSLRAGNSQDEKWLRSFLQLAGDLRAKGRLEIRLPRDFAGGGLG